MSGLALYPTPPYDAFQKLFSIQHHIRLTSELLSWIARPLLCTVSDSRERLRERLQTCFKNTWSLQREGCQKELYRKVSAQTGPFFSSLVDD